MGSHGGPWEPAMDENKSDYFSAIQAGMVNYEPMKEMFKRVLHASQQGAHE